MTQHTKLAVEELENLKNPEEIVKLNNVIKELASVVGSINPDSEAIVKRTIANVSKALYQK
jgi:hypothetical protein